MFYLVLLNSFLVALGSTVLTLANATLASFVAIWTPAGGDGLTGYEVTYQKFLKANGNQNVSLISLLLTVFMY